MPFKSEKQRRYLHANEPEMAKRWEKEDKPKQKAMAKGLRKYGGNGSGATIGAAASG
jgi:hypothetical protein